MTRIALVLLVTTITACGTAAPPPPVDPVRQQAAAEPAVRALRGGDFTGARAAAEHALAADRRNAVAAAVRALATYQAAGERLRDELTGVLDSAKAMDRLDHPRARTAWTAFADQLAEVEADLAVAAADPAFALELCLACWDHDWNHTGEIDDGDRLLFQIEVDARGDELPEADPRRTPTFRFDAGDVEWARAMIAFQRAASELVLAYKWNELDKLAKSDLPRTLTIELDDAGRVRTARELIRAGLDHSDRSRALYLAETDDDREWVPNPSQRDHAVPLVMDTAMYATWAAVTRDVRAIVDGREGIDLGEVMGREWKGIGLVDIGHLFDHPGDVRIDLGRLFGPDAGGVGLRALIKELLGGALRAHMAKSPLTGRLLRMMRELDHDEDTFGRKLRYFLWIN